MRARQVYTVFGYWADSNERFGERYEATDARDAEEQALAQARRDDGDLKIAGTLVGEHDSVDRYTAFIDPRDEANFERDDLEAVTDEPEVVEWTILGLALSPYRETRHRIGRLHIGLARDTDAQAWNEQTGGERTIIHEMAYSPLIAEDLARERVLKDSGQDLVVCTVLAGTKHRCESYPFADHRVRAE